MAAEAVRSGKVTGHEQKLFLTLTGLLMEGVCITYTERLLKEWL